MVSTSSGLTPPCGDSNEHCCGNRNERPGQNERECRHDDEPQAISRFLSRLGKPSGIGRTVFAAYPSLGRMTSDELRQPILHPADAAVVVVGGIAQLMPAIQSILRDSAAQVLHLGHAHELECEKRIPMTIGKAGTRA